MISRMGWGSAALALLVLVMTLTSQASAGCAVCGDNSANQDEAWKKEVNNFMAGDSVGSSQKVIANNQMDPKIQRKIRFSSQNESSDLSQSISESSSSESASDSSGASGSNESGNTGRSAGSSSGSSARSPGSGRSDVSFGTDNTLSSRGSGASDASSRADSGYSAIKRSKYASAMLVPLSEVQNADVVLDISPEATEYIDGAVNIPYTDFLKKDGSLNSVSELARALGNAGINRDDNVVIYGECQPCGGGPSASTFVYWMMKYLGHDNVRLMDGTIDDWVAAKKPTEASPKTLPSATYIPAVNSSLLSTYDYVKSGVAQMVDARTELEYQQGIILSAQNLPYDQVLDGKRIKSEASLKELFLGLDKDKPVVVFTNTGVKASLVWFTLILGGYDARIYTWQDWLKNQPVLNISLVDIKAVPNPARTGDDVNLTAVFGEGKAPSASMSVESAGNATESAGNGTSKPSKEIKLTTKGCATCGFGSPQSFAKIDKSSGVARLGASLSEGIVGFSCLAIIRDSNGGQLGKIALKQASEGSDVYSGIWKANVVGGTYGVTLQASTPGATKNFSNVLQIDVVGSS